MDHFSLEESNPQYFVRDVSLWGARWETENYSISYLDEKINNYTSSDILFGYTKYEIVIFQKKKKVPL